LFPIRKRKIASFQGDIFEDFFCSEPLKRNCLKSSGTHLFMNLFTEIYDTNTDNFQKNAMNGVAVPQGHYHVCVPPFILNYVCWKPEILYVREHLWILIYERLFNPFYFISITCVCHSTCVFFLINRYRQ
jgi:hypothetical protein